MAPTQGVGAQAAAPGAALGCGPPYAARVLVLLAPSEGKARPAAGAPVDLAALAYPELTARRERLLDTLAKLSAGPHNKALAALGLSAGQVGELELDAGLRDAPAATAAEIYTGVLYQRLRLAELAVAERAPVLIASALWGVLRPDDRIPAYRLAIGARLPRIRSLAAWWKPALTAVLPDGGLVVDLRSGAYAAAWTPTRADVVAVRGFVVAADGSRKPVSHMAKRVRGDVARVLLTTRPDARTPLDVAEAVTAAGLRAELQPARRGFTLDVLESTA